MEHDQAAKVIIDCIERFWSQNERPLLLSKLGTMVEEEAVQTARHLEGGLRAFIDARLSDDIRVLQVRGSSTVVAAIPRRIAEDRDCDDLMADVMHTSGVERFNPSFWAAFRKPLNETKRRFLTIQDPIRFSDLLPDDPQPPNTVEIPSEFIPDEGANDAEVYQAASRWIKDKGLRKERFIGKPVPPSRQPSQLPPDDLLGRVIVALDIDEVRHVAMSMEVVAKLRRTPV